MNDEEDDRIDRLTREIIEKNRELLERLAEL